MEGNEESSHKRTHGESKNIKTLIVEMPHLPQDVIVEILVRLPVKSLLKFRCVSKSWLSLISSPKFIKAHLTHSTLDPTLSNYRLMRKYRDSLQHFPVNCVFRERWTDVVAIDCPKFRFTKRSFNIEGSCNGLLLVVGNLFWDGIFLWNPSLRMLKELPLPEFAAKAWDRIRFGIGYDEPNDDYKVVVLFLSFCTDNYFGVSAVESYSLKNDSWKSIKEFDGGVLASGFSVIYANGKFHFPASLESSLEPDDISLESDDDSVWSKWDIVSLDLENEVYGTFEPPISDVFYSIGVLKDCIGALYTCYPQGYDDLWVLKEYGVKESWTKLVRIPRVDGPPSIYSGYQFPLCISSNGKVLLGRGYHLVVYDPEDNSFVYYPNNDCRNDKIKSKEMYVESLVPLPNPEIYFKTALEGYLMYAEL